MAAKLRNDASLGGRCRASSTRARTNGASSGPSLMRPPEGGVSPVVGAHPCRGLRVVAKRAARAQQCLRDGHVHRRRVRRRECRSRPPMLVAPVCDGGVARFAVGTHSAVKCPEVWRDRRRVCYRGVLARVGPKGALGEGGGLCPACLQCRTHPR
eukprot:521512-Pleurochrysis_carterae.AAC.2